MSGEEDKVEQDDTDQEDTEEEDDRSIYCAWCGDPIESREDLDEEWREQKDEYIHKACREEIKKREKEREEERKRREERVFKGELTIQRDTWKPLLTVMNRILEEATFRVNGETITVCEMDAKRVGMFRGVIQKETIEDFVEEQPDKIFRVDLPTFINAVKQAGYPCTVKSDGAHLYFENSWGSYRMPLFDDYGEATPIPNIEYTAHMTLDVSEIFDKLKWIKDKPEGVRLTAKDGKLSCKFGNVIGEELEAEIGECKGEATASYSLEYLKVISERYSFNKWDIDFATEMPLHAQKTKRVEERGSVQMDLWLAPRID